MRAVLVLAEQPALVYAQPLVPADAVVDVDHLVVRAVVLVAPTSVKVDVQAIVHLVAVEIAVQAVLMLALEVVAETAVQTVLAVVENVRQLALLAVVLDARVIVQDLVKPWQRLPVVQVVRENARKIASTAVLLLVLQLVAKPVASIAIQAVLMVATKDALVVVVLVALELVLVAVVVRAEVAVPVNVMVVVPLNV